MIHPTQKIRIHWIDVARGIGIICVMYGHLMEEESLRYLLYAFHIPLFFFLSGVVFKFTPDTSFWQFTKKNVKQLLYPYFSIALLTYFFDSIKLPFVGQSPDKIFETFYGILYGNGNAYLDFNVALWFLPCLFATKLLFAAILKRTNSKKDLLTLICISAIISTSLTIFPWISLPFGLETAFTAILFLAAGYGFKQKAFFTSTINRLKIPLSIWLILIFLATAIANYASYGQQVDMRMHHLNNIFLFYLSAFSGILLTIMLSMQIKQQAFLEYLGKHSLVLYAWHTTIFVYLKILGGYIFVNQFAKPLWYSLQFVYLIIAGGFILGLRYSIAFLRNTARQPK